MSKLKALVFYTYLPPWRIDVFNAMADLYDMTIVFTDADRDGFTYNREELLSKLDVRIKTVFLDNGFRIGSRPIRVGIYKIIKAETPDVVFSHEYSPTSAILALYKQIKLFGYKYYITTSDNVQMAELSSGLKAKSRSYVLNNSDGVVVYSESVKSWYKEHFPKLKVEVCPNIQNPTTLLSYRQYFEPIITRYREIFNIDYNSNIILYTGRLTEVKGLDLLLNAFAKSHIANYKLVLVGNGNLENDLKKQVSSLALEGRVIFAGYYTDVELYAWYDMANFFILPSRYEPFGAVVNEALIYGCPVVASKYIGALDFIDDNNGIVFDPLNENEFVQTLKTACNKYPFVRELRKNLMKRSFNKYVVVFKNINT